MPPHAPTDDGPAPAPAHHPHTTTTAERGSFALARCTCGWSGPARRSRDRARTDAASHAAEAATGLSA
ncbi:hypothetical protein [Streptomyces tsukubensis]|uniref:Uncharacterized protein n=1 Tax=Streptomyces tsukubensis (strain DSM 42081 / NBRC 108919 / NRRL 18488 / 9993) TaxID=1114943 RepID=A0A7G3UJ48_STRT9|nr:hypothetical protein [Streptomyces tsukubensis]AZK94977.1 hypothetical protein B7R87_14690 [Streptomyces tsukubensis]QKM68952.1 hypothetical protein STSU_019085 [Streptomyces tsukubensis NRRL18488]TAI40833.1 hypothetical protein EWI31_31155 [Streptomyces tsukubensis]